MHHLLTQEVACLQLKAFKGDLKIRKPLCACILFLLDFTSLNCNGREVSLSLLFTTHRQLLKEEVYNYTLKVWAQPMFWVMYLTTCCSQSWPVKLERLQQPESTTDFSCAVVHTQLPQLGTRQEVSDV